MDDASSQIICEFLTVAQLSGTPWLWLSILVCLSNSWHELVSYSCICILSLCLILNYLNVGHYICCAITMAACITWLMSLTSVNVQIPHYVILISHWSISCLAISFWSLKLHRNLNHLRTSLKLNYRILKLSNLVFCKWLVKSNNFD